MPGGCEDHAALVEHHCQSAAIFTAAWQYLSSARRAVTPRTTSCTRIADFFAAANHFKTHIPCQRATIFTATWRYLSHYSVRCQAPHGRLPLYR